VIGSNFNLNNVLVKKDKIAEVQKIMREKEAQQTREDELREMAIKLRRRLEVLPFLFQLAAFLTNHKLQHLENQSNKIEIY